MMELVREQECRSEPVAAVRTRGWFRWVAAGALMALAAVMVVQVSLQKRILARGAALREAVAESRAISAELMEQLGDVQRLHDATIRMDDHLARIAYTNAQLRGEVDGLNRTVAAIAGAVGRLDAATGESHRLLADIAREAAALQETLGATLSAGDGIAEDLDWMVRLQSGINADLREINVKTRWIGG